MLAAMTNCKHSGSGSGCGRCRGLSCPSELGRLREATGQKRDGRKLHHVPLDNEERALLQETVDSGKVSKTRQTRAHILLLADGNRDDGGRKDVEVASAITVGTATVEQVRKRCVLYGLDAALERMEQVNRTKPVLDGEGEANGWWNWRS